MGNITSIKRWAAADIDAKSVPALAARLADLKFDADRQQAIEASFVDAELVSQVDAGVPAVDVLLYAATVAGPRWAQDCELALALCRALAKQGRIDDVPFVAGVWCHSHPASQAAVATRIPSLVMEHYAFPRSRMTVEQRQDWETENPKWRDHLASLALDPDKFGQAADVMLCLMQTYRVKG